MIKVVCIKERIGRTAENIGDIFYLDHFTIYGDSEGDWYGEMYKKDENEKFIRVGYRLLSRFKNVMEEE